MNFKNYNLDRKILRALDLLNYTSPTKVQTSVLDKFWKNDDLIVQSKTGSGKTAAFAIPICEDIEIENRNKQVLVVVPTRELALQIKEEISLIGRFKKIRCASIFGKQSIEMQQNELKQRVHIIVATPGRLIDHIKRGNIKLKNIETLVLDEADEMLELGFIEDVDYILDNTKNRLKTMFFSATMPDFVIKLADKYMKNPEIIKVEDEKEGKFDLKQSYYQIDSMVRKEVLDKLLKKHLPEFGLIFCNTRAEVEAVTKYLKKLGYLCEGLHGGLSQGMRIKIFQKFRRGQYRLLITTSLAARGVDFDKISHVINYDLPLKHEEYIHRIGRTARIGNKGHAISLIRESDMDFMEEIQRLTGCVVLKEKLDDSINENKDIELLKQKPREKKDKAHDFNKNIVRIRINAGKNKKIRPGDLVGTILSIDSIKSEDIGIIDIQKTCSYIEILNGKGDFVFSKLEKKTIKGKEISMKKVRMRNF